MFLTPSDYGSRYRITTVNRACEPILKSCAVSWPSTLGDFMKIKMFAAAALGLSIAGAANAQSWERWDEGGAQARAEGASLTFGCGADDPTSASLKAVVAFDLGNESAMFAMSMDRPYEATFVVDGSPTPIRMMFIGDGEEGIALQAIEPVSDDGMKLVDLTTELRNGNRLVLQIPALGVSVPFSLNGSRNALNGVYLGCGMWPTGTGVWTEDEYDLNGTD